MGKSTRPLLSIGALGWRGREGRKERARMKVCAHRRSSGAKGNHLVETAGVWESAAIRQTSLAPADYLKARSPPLVASAADNLIPQKRRKNYKVGGGKKTKRRGGGREEDFFPCHPTLSGERRPTLPFPRNLLCSTSIYRCIS